MEKQNTNIKKIVLNHRLQILLLLLVNIVFSLVLVNIPKYLSTYIDVGFSTQVDLSYLKKLAIVFLLLNLFKYVFVILKQWLTTKLAWSLGSEIRESLYFNFSRYDDNFYQSSNAGSLSNIINKDIKNIEYFITSTLSPIIINFLNVIYIIILYLNENFLLAFIFLIYYIISISKLIQIQERGSNVFKEKREKEIEIEGQLFQIIKAKKEINIMNGLDYFLDNTRTKLDELLAYRTRAVKFMYKIWIYSLMILSMSNILALFVGGILYFNSYISIGFVYLIYSYSNLLKSPMEHIQEYLNSYQMARQSIDRINTILSYKNKTKSGPCQLGQGPIEIEIRNLNFSYDNKKLVLKGINLELEPARVYGLIGHSGSGKTSLIKTLTQQVPVEDKSIFLNGKDINTLSLETIQDNICIFSVEDSLFDASLIENIRLFNKSITEDIVIDRLVEYDFFAGMTLFKNEDLNSILNENINRLKLSEEEKQMVKISGLLFLDKGLIIFDEAGSNLSQTNNDYLMDIIKSKSKTTSFILVSHKLERLSSSYKIISLEDGNLIDFDYSDLVLEKIDFKGGDYE